MSKKILFLLVVLSFVSVSSKRAYSLELADQCAGTTKIIIDNALQDGSPMTTLNNVLTAYPSKYSDRLVGNTYCLILEIKHGAMTIKRPLSFRLLNDANVYISGIQLIQDSLFSDNTLPLISFTNNKPDKQLVVNNINLKDVKNGILLATGSGKVELSNSTITGDGSKLGACIEVNSPSAKITGGEYSYCREGILVDPVATNMTIEGSAKVHHNGKGIYIKGDGAIVTGGDIYSNTIEGIRIEANNALLGASDAAGYDIEKNIIRENGIGIHLANGSNNKFAYNSLYHNGTESDPNGSKKGIWIDEGGNNGILPPDIVSSAEGSLHCKKDDNGAITSRKIVMASVSPNTEIVFYKTDSWKSQGEQYITKCKVESDGSCSILDLPGWLGVEPSQCGRKDILAITLSDGENSSAYSKPIILYGSISADVVSPSGIGPLIVTGAGVASSPDTPSSDLPDDTEFEDNSPASGNSSPATGGGASSGGLISSEPAAAPAPAHSFGCQLLNQIR